MPDKKKKHDNTRHKHHEQPTKEESKAAKLLRYWDEFQKPVNQKSYALFKKEFFKLLKNIIPEKFTAEGVVGFDDPSVTGLFFAFLAALMPVFGESLNITASFDEPVVEGTLDIKGRIRVLWIVTFAGRLMLDKNIRKLVKSFLKNR